MRTDICMDFRMGYELISKIPRAKHLVCQMDNALQSLPEPYRPSWKLLDELSREAEVSRIHEAIFSQPLCTVIQIILVELLKIGGLTFSAVVGHSSGEIGAAYASGFLSASDAVKIAYLRGYHAHLATGPNGEPGAMMAVGMSIREAEDLCYHPDFEGRIQLAACNSSSSLTLSGDATAISQAKAVCDEQKKFARLLKVDTAYHSSHMEPCAGPYLQSMKEAQIEVQESHDRCCIWYSSVLDGAKMERGTILEGQYWRDNMVNTVLLHQAITRAVTDGSPFHVALEVGPHPALKGPITQTLRELEIDVPYLGTLRRGQDDIKPFSECLGELWCLMPPSTLNFEALENLLPRDVPPPRLIKGLPCYAWDHTKTYWHESRVVKQYRSRSRLCHELLGTQCDGSDYELRWRNFLSVQEVPWLEGHRIQGQIVLPVSGYISMALEASKVMSRNRNAQLIEVEHLSVNKAIVFRDDSTVVETLVTLSNISIHVDGDGPDSHGVIAADFTLSSCQSRDAASLTKAASGKVRVLVGSLSDAPALPTRIEPPSQLRHVDAEYFYAELDSVGYNYMADFRGISDIRRRMNFFTGLTQPPANTASIIDEKCVD